MAWMKLVQFLLTTIKNHQMFLQSTGFLWKKAFLKIWKILIWMKKLLNKYDLNNCTQKSKYLATLNHKRSPARVLKVHIHGALLYLNYMACFQYS